MREVFIAIQGLFKMGAILEYYATLTRYTRNTILRLWIVLLFESFFLVLWINVLEDCLTWILSMLSKFKDLIQFMYIEQTRCSRARVFYKIVGINSLTIATPLNVKGQGVCSIALIEPPGSRGGSGCLPNIMGLPISNRAASAWCILSIGWYWCLTAFSYGWLPYL